MKVHTEAIITPKNQTFIRWRFSISESKLLAKRKNNPKRISFFKIRALSKGEDEREIAKTYTMAKTKMGISNLVGRKDFFFWETIFISQTKKSQSVKCLGQRNGKW